jgi:hypothetical protein
MEQLSLSESSILSSSSSSKWRIPQKGIFSEQDVQKFRESNACKNIMEFIEKCGASVKGLKARDPSVAIPPVISSLGNFFDSLYALVDEFPPLDQPMRYGNKAFRQWYAALLSKVPAFLETLLPVEKRGAAIEIGPYLIGAFGNETRIDFGTGHELSLVVFFFCLLHLEIIESQHLPSLVIHAFPGYMRVVRRLQTSYMLEPAGSHGVWGLDDYHCLLFVWGAFQLLDHESIEPKSVLSDQFLEHYANDFLYVEGIHFIRQVKSKAPFAETSPMLYSIANMSDWKKVCSGMLRLFQGEVLFKFPVVQHLPFGTIICGDDWIKEPKAGSADFASSIFTKMQDSSVRGTAPWARHL